MKTARLRAVFVFHSRIKVQIKLVFEFILPHETPGLGWYTHTNRKRDSPFETAPFSRTRKLSYLDQIIDSIVWSSDQFCHPSREMWFMELPFIFFRNCPKISVIKILEFERRYFSRQYQ